MMQKQGHRRIINDRLVRSENVRPKHALHTRRSLRDESFVHVCKIDSVDAVTAKRATIQRQRRTGQRMYRQRDASGSASELANVACPNAFRPAIGKIDDRTRGASVEQNVHRSVVQYPDKLQMPNLVADEWVSVKTVLGKQIG